MMPMIDLLSECATKLLEHLGGSTEVLFASAKCPMDGSPSVSAWDAKHLRFVLVDLGDRIDVRYPTWRVRADEVMRRAAMPFVRIAAFRTRQELAGRLNWLPSDTVVWIASEPKHHIDFGGNRLIGPRTTR